MARRQYFKASTSIIVNESSEFFLQVIKQTQYASFKATNHTFHLSKKIRKELQKEMKIEISWDER